jgi:pyruvate dehydrogenase E2 component (dihydrolipoamide acetyltransferase)
MAREFKLPDLGEGIHEGEIVDILVAVGDQVKEDQPILVIETDKATTEIPSPFTGKVSEIRVNKGDQVHVGDVLLVFDGDGAAEGPEVRAQPSPVEASTPETVPTTAPAQEPPAPAQQPPVPPPPAQPPAKREGPVPAAPSTRRLARELGVDLALVPPSGPAGLVTADDVRAFAEGKAAAPAPGAAPPPAAPPSEARPAPAQAPAAAPQAGGPLAPIAPPPLPDFTRWGQVERVPLRSVRRSTARHMALAWSQIPHVNHQDVADITELEAFRQSHKEAVKQQGGSLTLTVFALKAVVAALKAFPRFNSSLDTATEEIVLKHYYHVGVATDTDRGLLVPVVRDVDRKSLSQLAQELPKLVQRTQSGEVALEEMQGGTFTITNIGILGGTGFAPIVNYPEVAILGIGKARLQPVIRGDLEAFQVVPRLILPLVLAFDHRVLDGAEAARFTNLVIEILEDPNKLMLNV